MEVDLNPDGTQFRDRCFACRRDTPPSKIVRGNGAGGVRLTRSFYSCAVDHGELTHADWWTDWTGWDDAEREVVERVQLFDPARGDGGTTWSGGSLKEY
jgi:hypothetical protein